MQDEDVAPRPPARARLHVDAVLSAGHVLELPPTAARHVQVLRLQPGQVVSLFDGRGQEVAAVVERMGRQSVMVRLGAPLAAVPEVPVDVTLAVVVPAGDRMDALVEKATELGAAALQPLQSQRSVLRLQGARAMQRREHWQSVAIAACEQCGRARVPAVRPLAALDEWLERGDLPPDRRLLSPRAATPAHASPHPTGAVVVLSGPEGGLAPEEEARARARGFVPVRLGRRVLRADTAPLAWLAHLMVSLDAQEPGPP